MNKTFTHGKPKLALATLTSPGAAFEEILRRRLLGTALIIVAVAGVLSTVAAVERAIAGSPVDYFALGRYNPLTWFGLFLLYALAVQKLLNWLRTEVDYATILIVMGWSQVALVLAHTASVVSGALAIAGYTGATATQVTDSLSTVLQLAYVALVGVGITTACGGPLSRGILSYLVVQFAAVISLGITYVNSRTRLLSEGMVSIYRAAHIVAQVDMIPWIAAAVVGLVMGMWNLGKHLGWKRELMVRAAAGAGAAGALLLVTYTYAFVKTDYYGRLLTIQQYHDTDKFTKAARAFGLLETLARNNPALQLDTNMDLARIYYVDGNPQKALEYYRKSIDLIKKSNTGPKEGRLLAQPYTETGAAYDAQGEYEQAIKHFEMASKAWPEFRDPRVRMAITYNRMGRYDEALKAAEHATGKLGSKASVAQVALVEAYAGTGVNTKARKTYAALSDHDKDLARRIGRSPEDWKNAVSKLTLADLRFPLEKEPAPAPQPPKQAKK